MIKLLIVDDSMDLLEMMKYVLGEMVIKLRY